MAKYLRLPDGSLYEAPDNMSYGEAMQLARKDYPDAFGAAQPQSQEPVEQPKGERTWGEAVTDTGAGLVKGVGNLVQLPGQLYGLATGDFSDTGVLAAGKRIYEAGEGMESDVLKQRRAAVQQKVQAAEDQGAIEAFKTSFMETIKDPALLSSFVAEQLPQLIPIIASGGAAAGVAAGRASAAALAKGATSTAAVKAAQAAAIKVGTTAAIHTGALMQGTDVGADTYDAIYKNVLQRTKDPQKAAEAALNRARAAGVAGYGISVLANRYILGGEALEKALLSGKTGVGMVTGAVTGGLKAIPSENVEELGGALARNIALKDVDPTQPLTQGLGETAAQATLGAVALGGFTGANAGRGGAAVERDKRQEERAAQERAAAEEAKAKAEQMADPQYLLDIGQRYDALIEQRKQLREIINRKVEKDDLDGQQTKQDARRQMYELDQDITNRDLVREYRAAKPRIEELRRAPEDVMLSYIGMGAEPTEGIQARGKAKGLYAGQPSEEAQTQQPDPSVQWARGVVEWATDPSEVHIRPLEQRSGQSATGGLDDLAALLMERPERAAVVAKTRPNIPGLNAWQNTQLIKRVDAQLQGLQRQAAQAGRQATQAAQARIGEVESEEAAALESARAEDERMRAEREAEAQRTARLIPEAQALYRMGQRPGPAIPQPGMFASEQPELIRAEAPSVGQAAQQLAGATRGLDLQFNEDRNRALGPEAVGTGEPQVTGPARRVEGGFRLFNEPGAPAADVGFGPLQQRVARLLASPDLSDEGYAFLRRVEDTLPRADAQVQEIRKGQTTQGYEQDVAQLGSLYDALDEQIGAIERGEQGVVTEGPPKYEEDAYRSEPAAASTAAMRPAFGTEVQAVLEGRPVKEPVPRGQPDTLERQEQKPRVVPAAQRRTVTAPNTLRGPSTSVRPGDLQSNVPTRRGGKPLQVPRQLSEQLALYEQVRTEDQAAQLPLFEDVEKERGAIKPDPEAFKRFMNSPFVRKLQKNLRESKELLKKRKPIEQMKKQVDALTAKVEAMRKAAAEYRTERVVLEDGRKLLSMQRSVRDLSESLTKRVLDDMQLRGALQKAREDVAVFERAAEMARGTPAYKDLSAELNKTRDDLEALQAEHAALQIALKTLDGQIRVAKAANRIAELRNAAPFPYELAEAEAELRAAQVTLGDAIVEVGAQERMAKAQTAAEQRAAEAVNMSNRRKQERAKFRAEQKRLEAVHSAAVDRRRFDALDDAQRSARERLLSGESPEIPETERVRMQGDPYKVLGGYRARIRDLEKQIMAGFRKSKTFAGTNLEKLRKTHDNLYEQYRQAKTAEQRDVIGVKYDQAAEALRAAEQRFKTEPVMWPGAKRVLDELDAVTFKAEWLESAINRGEFDDIRPQAAEAFARTATAVAERRAAENKAAAEAAAARADAPTTSGEPLTRTEVKKATKAKGTVYKARGGVEAKRMYADYQAAIEIAKTAQSEERGGDFVGRQTQALSAQAQEAASDGRLLDVLDDIIANSTNPLTRELAAKFKPLMLRTKLQVEPQQFVVDGVRLEGQYDPETNTIRMDPEALTEEALMHEVAHAATLRALAVPENELSAQQVAAKRELENLYREIQSDPAFAEEYARKDLSEFVSEVLSNGEVRAKLDARKPTLLSKLHELLLRLIGITPESSRSERARKAAEALFMPSRPFVVVDKRTVASVMRGVFPNANIEAAAGTPNAISKGVSQIVGRGEQSWWQKVQANVAGLAFRTQFLDNYAPIEQLTRMGVERGKLDSMRAFQTMYYLRFGQQRNQFLAQAASRGVPQLVKNQEGGFTYEAKEGPNLAEISRILSDAAIGDAQQVEGEFTAFLAIRRAMQVPGGFEKLNTKEPMTRAQAEAFMADVAADPKRQQAFEHAAEVYRQYNANLLDFLVQTGAMEKVKADALKRGDFVPFYRSTPDGTVELVVMGERPVRIGDVASQPYLKELLGDDQKILPVFTSALQNTAMLLDMGLRNQAVKDTAYTMRDLGMGKVGSGVGPTGARSKRNTLHFKEKGADRFLIMDEAALDQYGVPAELLVKGMEGIKTTLPWVVKAMSVPANWLRAGVTRMPTYALRQLIRDPINAWLVTGGNFTPVLSSLGEMAKMQGGRSPTEAVLQRAGAISSNVFTGDKADWSRTLRDISAGKSTWDTALAKLDAFATQGDTATRAVLYNMYRERGMTHMEALLGSLESMNFSRRGVSPTMHFLSTMIPFFNAQIQGMDVIYRAAKGVSLFEKETNARGKLLARGALMLGSTLLYAAMMQDDEAYKNATDQERALNWFVRFPGLDEPVRIPIPFELGYAFKAIPEMLINAAAEDKEAGDVVAGIAELLYSSIPLGIPQALKPGIEVAANHSFYSGRDIVSSREQALEPEAQIRQNTTALAQMLGSAAGVSPIQIDYLIRGYFGGLGALVAQMPNIVFRPGAPDEQVERAERKLSELPVVGSLFQPTDGRGIIDEAYKTSQEFERKSRTYKALVEQGRRAEAQAFAQRYIGEIAAASEAGRFRQQMGEFAKYRRFIQASPNLSAPEKREQLDALRKLEIAYAQQLQALGKTTRR